MKVLGSHYELKSLKNGEQILSGTVLSDSSCKIKVNDAF